MVGHDVDDDADSDVVQCCGQGVELGERAESRVHIAVVVDIIAAVCERGRVERAEPDSVDAQSAEVGHLLDDSGEIADAVGVGVGEAARVDLVDGGLTPPIVVVEERGRARTRF